jgi:hypothetical protein
MGPKKFFSLGKLFFLARQCYFSKTEILNMLESETLYHLSLLKDEYMTSHILHIRDFIKEKDMMSMFEEENVAEIFAIWENEKVANPPSVAEQTLALLNPHFTDDLAALNKVSALARQRLKMIENLDILENGGMATKELATIQNILMSKIKFTVGLAKEMENEQNSALAENRQLPGGKSPSQKTWTVSVENDT